MKLLREYIRELLTESAGIDPSVMKLIDQAEAAGYYVEVGGTKSGKGVVYIYGDNENGSKNKVGAVSWYQNGRGIEGLPIGPCSQASIVNYAQVFEGFEMLAYDVAIEASGGLTSDRTEVSREEESIWNTYMTSRSDVMVSQLDILDRLPPGSASDRRPRQLNPDDRSADCDQYVAIKRNKKQWHTSPLSKVYKKSGTPVMDELRRRGMLR